MVTTPMVSSNTSGGASANVSNANGSSLQVGPVFNATGSARIRIYSPAVRAIQAGPVVIATPATGVGYTNKLQVPLRVLMNANGATVTSAVISRGDANATYSLGTGFLTGGDVVLYPNDSLTMVYSAATPIMTGFAPA